MLKFKSYRQMLDYSFRFSCDTTIKGGKIIKSKIGKDPDNVKCELFIRDTSEPNVYSIGCKQLADGIFHNTGYVWSSRAGVINRELGSKLVEVLINDSCYYVDVDYLYNIISNTPGFSNVKIKSYHPFWDKTKNEEDREIYYDLEFDLV